MWYVWYGWSVALNLEGNGSETSSLPASPGVGRFDGVFGLDEAVVSASKKKRKTSLSSLYHGPGGAKLPKGILNSITMFQRKQNKVSKIYSVSAFKLRVA